MFLLQSVGLVLMVTSGFYMLKLYRGTAHLDNKAHKKLLLKVMTTTILGAGSSASALYLDSN